MFTLLFILFLLSIITFVVGLIKPSLIKMDSRKKVLKIGSATVIILFVLSVVTAPELTDEERVAIEEREQAKEEEKEAEELKKQEEQKAKEEEEGKKAEQQKKEEAKKAEEEATKKEQKKKEAEAKAKRPENVVESVVKKAFGDDAVDKINYNEDNSFVLIRVLGSDNLTTNMIKRGMWMDTEDVLRELDGVDGIDTIDFNILFPMVDQYGNSSDDIVMKLSFDKEIREKINWDNFLTDNIPNISENYWEHPALNK